MMHRQTPQTSALGARNRILQLLLLSASLVSLANGSQEHSRAVSSNHGAPEKLTWPIWWFAPFWSTSGYGTEAISYVLSLLRSDLVRKDDIWITQHGDRPQELVVDGMDSNDREDLHALEVGMVNSTRSPIILCHSWPPGWAFSPAQQRGAQACPPDGAVYKHAYLIGRTMFETDRLPPRFVVQCNSMQEVWVPSEFARRIFIEAGVQPGRLVVLPQGINTSRYDPMLYRPAALPRGQLVFGGRGQGAIKADIDGDVDGDSGSDGNGGGSTGNAGRRLAAGAAAAAISGTRLPVQHDDAATGSSVAVEHPRLAAATARSGGPGVQAVTKLDSWSADSRHGWTQGQARKAAAVQDASRSDSSRALRSASAWREQAVTRGAAAVADGADRQPLRRRRRRRRKPYRFLSVFKWETRKGWDILLEAYLSEFTLADHVELYIVTRPFAGSGNFSAAMHQWASEKLGERMGLPAGSIINPALLPRIYVMQNHISDRYYPMLYKACDVFVLPTRGEGWGRPHVEAMSMGLPVISTNWSGITAYLDDSVGYPLHVDKLITINDTSLGLFNGHQWAQPSTAHLRTLMRHLYTHQEEGRQKGAAARQRMIERFSPPVLARRVASELRRIQSIIPHLPAQIKTV